MSPDWSSLHRDVCFGESDGKIVWQPRIGAWFMDRIWDGGELPSPYTGMSWADLYRDLNCSARLYNYNTAFRPVESEKVVRTERRLNDTDAEITYTTPVGKQVEILRQTPNSRIPIRLKRLVADEAELKVGIWRHENTTWEWDESFYEKTLSELGDLGAPTMYMPRVTVQDLFINTMGTQDGIYAIYDWPDTVDAYCRALDESHDRLMDVINDSPVEIINFGDNLHCGILPPHLFCKYVLPSYQRRCAKLHEGGKFVSSHYDGDTKTLLPLVKETGLDGIEAITPQPQGDVTLEEMKDALGDEMFLLDGIPAIYFNETYSVSVLEDCARRVIELFAPKLILGISDEMSSNGNIERIRIVGQIVEEYNSGQ